MQKSVTELKSISEQIHNKYNETSLKYLYIDNKFNENGTNYTRFLKIKNYSINNNLINNHYELKGWYVLWCLMSYATNSEYIETTISLLITKCNLKENDIKKALLELDKKQIISLKCNTTKIKINKDTLMSIAILYNNNIDDDHGYKPLPLGISKILIKKLNPTQWAIYTLLISKYSYFSLQRYSNEQTGILYYNYKENNYSFPTEEQISECLGINRKTIRKQLEVLEQLDLIKIVKYQEFKNKRYEVKLMQRYEYLYHYTYKLKDNRKDKIIELINKKGFIRIAKSPEQNILNDRDYILYKFGDELNDYDIAYKNSDSTIYDKLRKNK